MLGKTKEVWLNYVLSLCRCSLDLVVVFLYPSEIGLRKIRNKGTSHLTATGIVVWLYLTSSSKYLRVYSIKHLCTVDLKIYLIPKPMHCFLLVEFSTAVTGLRCFCFCIAYMLSSFICHAKNELNLWSNHPLCCFHFLFLLFIISGLLLSWLFSMQPYLVLCWNSSGVIRPGVGIRWEDWDAWPSPAAGVGVDWGSILSKFSDRLWKCWYVLIRRASAKKWSHDTRVSAALPAKRSLSASCLRVLLFNVACPGISVSTLITDSIPSKNLK